MKIRFSALAVATAALLSSPVLAVEFTEEAMAMCERVKSCALQRLNREQEMTAEMRDMMRPMLENMCEQVRANIQEVPREHRLYKPALACMRSLKELSCDAFERPENVATPECERYEELAAGE